MAEQIQYQVAVDTTDEPASRASAEGLGLHYEVLQASGPGGGWPEIQVTGPREQVLDFLMEHSGDERHHAVDYLEEFGRKV